MRERIVPPHYYPLSSSPRRRADIYSARHVPVVGIVVVVAVVCARTKREQDTVREIRTFVWSLRALLDPSLPSDRLDAS